MLWRGLSSLKQISQEPLTEAQLLGEALARALPVDEHESFSVDFRQTDDNLKRGADPDDSAAQALIDAIERFLKDNGKES